MHAPPELAGILRQRFIELWDGEFARGSSRKECLGRGSAILAFDTM
jgi:hypothetical protein